MIYRRDIDVVILSIKHFPVKMQHAIYKFIKLDFESPMSVIQNLEASIDIG